MSAVDFELISEATDLKVKAYMSGPMGGDQQIGAKIAEKKIDIVIFSRFAPFNTSKTLSVTLNIRDDYFAASYH